MSTPTKSALTRFLEGDLSVLRPLWRPRAFLIWGGTLSILAAIKLIGGPPTHDGWASDLGFAIGLSIPETLGYLTLPYLFLIGLELIIRAVRLTPSQTRIAKALAFVVFLIGVAFFVAIVPPRLTL